jgi:predicted alpha/beta superfamily hydrolase
VRNSLFFALLLLSIKLTAQVTYTVSVPEGTNACFIAGEMTGWNPVQMSKQNNSVYTITISYAKENQLYKYCSGPAWNFVETKTDSKTVTNRTYSAKDTVEKWSLVWNFTNNFPPAVSLGSIIRHWFTSKIVDNRYVDVWLPVNYNKAHKYAVLYMHDGQMLFDSTSTWNKQAWNIDKTLGNLLAKGSIEPTIVVAIHNNGNKRHAEYFPEKVINTIPEPQKSQLDSLFVGSTRADDYLNFIVTELKPFIDSNYSTYTDQQHTYMAGSSMGGLISLYAFCEYPNVFSRVACLSTHWIGTFTDNTQIPDAIDAYLKDNLPGITNRIIYFDHGTAGLDALYQTYQSNVDKILANKGFTTLNWKSEVYNGADHNEKTWGERFDIPAVFILSQSKTTAINTINIKDSYTLYPNPSHSVIFIKPFDDIKNKNIRIYNNYGKAVLCKPIILNGLDISLLTSGIYLVQFDQSVLKLIKN